MDSSINSNNKWWVLLAIGLGTFMTALDTSVTNAILPVVRDSFNADIATIEWVVTVYLLVLSGLLLSFGRLGDLQGHKRVYLIGFGVFVGSSLLCGIAPSVEFLIICRGMQALGGAMLAANSPAILTKSFPSNQRGQALGLQATMTYLGLTVGPSFGGWLAQAVSWRAVFYINLPVGILALWISWRFILDDHGKRTQENFDLAGAFLFLSGLTALLLGLNQGHNWGWSSPAILGLLGGAVILLGIFLAVESKVAAPMLDLTLFRTPRFSLATTSAILNYICVYMSIFLLPFYLIQGRGLNSAQAGLLLTAQPIVMAIVAPISGSLSDHFGTRLPSTIGMAVLAVGFFLLSHLDSTSSQAQFILALGTVGLGTGIFISPNNSAIMGSAPHQRQGIAAGILATARNFGMVLGVGLSGAIFTSILAQPDGGGIFPAIQTNFMVAIGIALLGVPTSWFRGN